MPAISDLPHLLFTTSGRAAIGLAMEELGIGAGDQVLVPTYHCPTMVSPIVAVKAEPVFFSIDAEGLPALESIERLDLRHVKAMIAVHYFGIPRRFKPARAFCDRHGIALIEDCAHAYFGSVDGLAVGTIGDLAIASLTKFFPVPEGGCLASQNRPIRTRGLERRGWLANARTLLDTVERGAGYHRFEPVGFALRGAFAAKDVLRGRRIGTGRDALAVLSEVSRETAMPTFDADLAHRVPTMVVRIIERHADRGRIASSRRANYGLLSTLLDGIPGTKVLEPHLPEFSVPYVFPLWIEEPERSYQALRRAGVPIFRWDVMWPSAPTLPGDWGGKWASHIFQLGCHQDLSETDIRKIASTVEALVGSRP
jgi:dTDP-4-amino-4,6-dideoxygalactose transaminase